MNLSKLNYRLTLAIYNACRRVCEWFKPVIVIEKPKSIIVGATVLLGDFLMQAPLVYALRQRYPEAKITLLVPKGWRSFAELMIGVDDVCEAEINNGKWLRDFRRQYRNAWDLGVIPFVNFLVPLFYGLGVRNILAFPDPKGRYRYQIHRCVKLPSKAAHLSRMMLSLIEVDNFECPAPHLRDPEIALPENLLGKSYVVIHPGASSSTRFWPSERYVAIGRELVSKNYCIVLTGTQKEKYLADLIEKELPQDKVINLAGKTSLLELAKILREAKAVLGPDTGVLHLAKAFAVPSVILLGPSQKEVHGLDPGFHNVIYTKALYIPDLGCRDRRSLFKHVIPGVGHCRRQQCLYSDIPCLLQIEEKGVLNALVQIGVL